MSSAGRTYNGCGPDRYASTLGVDDGRRHRARAASSSPTGGSSPGFCYRMLGSGSEAEDAVQETLVRAWRAIDGFEGRSSLRSWLYRIANNVCVDMLRSPQRRARPMDLGPVVHGRRGRARAAGRAHVRAADRRRAGHRPRRRPGRGRRRPASRSGSRSSPRCSTCRPASAPVLILCEVLRWQATEVAELLDTSVASVNSALQRARATLAAARAEQLDTDARPGARGAAGSATSTRSSATTSPRSSRCCATTSCSRCRRSTSGCRAPDVVGWFVGPGHRLRRLGCCRSRSTAPPASATTSRPARASGSRGPSR